MRYPLWSASCDSACSVGRLTQIFEGVSQKTQPHDPHTLWWNSVTSEYGTYTKCTQLGYVTIVWCCRRIQFPRPTLWWKSVHQPHPNLAEYKILSAHRCAQQGGGVDFKYSVVAQAAHTNVVVPIRGGGVLCADDVAPKSRPHSCAH